MTSLIKEVMQSVNTPSESNALVQDYLYNGITKTDGILMNSENIAHQLNKTLYALRGKAPQLFEKLHNSFDSSLVSERQSNGDGNGNSSSAISSLMASPGGFDMNSYRNIFNKTISQT
jgi:hypothetical protein